MTGPSIVIFGAGKIGLSFTGQIFGRAGYRVIFIESDPELVRELNRYNKYRVVIEGDLEETLEIKGVKAIHNEDIQNVTEAVAGADILSVNVGKAAIPDIISMIASGLDLRYKKSPDLPLDIILAENMRSAGNFVRMELHKHLHPDYPLDSLVGLIETSIGKMVPFITRGNNKAEPPSVNAEPYNTLILDKKGFRGPIPDVGELELKDNISAWVDRKAFIHNLGHTTAAYKGFQKHPRKIYMYEILEDPEVLNFTRETMLESAGILQTCYSSDYSLEDLTRHIDDLLNRFLNKALKDTVFRVGQDIPRKLGPDDRFMGIIRVAQQQNKPFHYILEAMSLALFFKAKDGKGKILAADKGFHQRAKKDLEACLMDTCGLILPEDRAIHHFLLKKQLTDK